MSNDGKSAVDKSALSDQRDQSVLLDLLDHESLVDPEDRVDPAGLVALVDLLIPDLPVHVSLVDLVRRVALVVPEGQSYLAYPGFLLVRANPRAQMVRSDLS